MSLQYQYLPDNRNLPRILYVDTVFLFAVVTPRGFSLLEIYCYNPTHPLKLVVHDLHTIFVHVDMAHALWFHFLQQLTYGYIRKL